MLDFRIIKDKHTGKTAIQTSLTGKLLLTNPQLNKGTAFTAEERLAFGLLGKLPAHLETLDQQVERAYLQYKSYSNNFHKNIYLNNLHDKNQVLFYKLVSTYLTEIMPIIYTPTVGTAVKEFSQEFRQPRGLYIAHTDRDQIETILNNRSHPEIDLIVVTDGEGVLGIGDQGIGAIEISIAKLMVYTLCTGFNPLRTLPIMLDAGTNNPKLLEDPSYLGLRQKRITGADYDDFMEKFITAVKKQFPTVFLHYEDFGRDNARRVLDRYRNQICSFNDDIQGTGVVTLAALLAAVKVTGTQLKDQRIIIFGAGTAGTGIADQLCAAMMLEGLTEEEARRCFWLFDRRGLLIEHMPNIMPAQLPYVRSVTEIAGYQKDLNGNINLLETTKQIQPTVLIGCSSTGGVFTQEIVETMTCGTAQPIIFPLSNPTECSEAQPADLLAWTNGKALIATGSPFAPVDYQGKIIRIAQCNNALAFPGIGLGISAVKANYCSDSMLWTACQTLASYSPALQDPTAPLLPSIADARTVARHIAIAVAIQAQREARSQISDNGSIEDLIDQLMWQPEYAPLVKEN